MMDDRAEKWSESIEKLLNDSVGLEIFTVSILYLPWTVESSVVIRL